MKKILIILAICFIIVGCDRRTNMDSIFVNIEDVQVMQAKCQMAMTNSLNEIVKSLKNIENRLQEVERR